MSVSQINDRNFPASLEYKGGEAVSQSMIANYTPTKTKLQIAIT